MHKLYLKLDFIIQTILISICAIDMLFGQNYVSKLLITIATVQSISIIYHSLIAKTIFSQLRKWHYAATCGILIFIFIMYFFAINDIDIFGEAVIILLFIISILSIILTLLYTVATYHSYKDAFENSKN